MTKSKNKPKCFITSVGTSLADNSGSKIRDIISEKDEVALEEFMAQYSHDRTFSERNIANIIKNIQKNGKLSAEINALERYNFDQDDKIILVCSRTASAYFCACALKYYFTKESKPLLSENNVQIEVVKGLRSPKNEHFQDRGLPDFLDIIVNIIEDHKKEFNVVLNSTGGYKSLFPFMTIAGIVYGLEVIYIFERSEHLIIIPPLPLHVNIPQWTQIESLIEVFEDKSDFKDKDIFCQNKQFLGPLLKYSEKAGKEVVNRSALVKAFSEHVSEERGKPELIIRTQNSPLVRNFLKPKHREIFVRLAKIGHLIWKGDRVPEMADHALRHHSDLFHIAERVLLPIFYYDSKFLESEELFILLCALYLHDCGHVIDRIKKEDGSFMPLLPLEIRDHHHVLGYMRLKYPEVEYYMGSLIYDQICNTDEKDPERKTKWKNCWTDYLGAVACLGLYHRKKMNLKLPDEYHFFTSYPVNDKDKIYPEFKTYLKEKPASVFGKKISVDKMTLIVSLLRIIDSLDEQSNRTGNFNDIRFHLTQLEIDAKTENSRAKAIGKAFSKDKKASIDSVLKALELGFILKEDKHADRKGYEDIEPIDKIDIFRQKFDAVIEKENIHPDLIFEYANSKIRAFFKNFQIKPYTEKVYIRGIKLAADYDNTGSFITLNIDLDMEDDQEKLGKLQASYPLKINSQKFDMTDENDRNRFKDSMIESISEEYTNPEKSKDNKDIKETIVCSTLAKNNIIFKYGN